MWYEQKLTLVIGNLMEILLEQILLLENQYLNILGRALPKPANFCQGNKKNSDICGQLFIVPLKKWRHTIQMFNDRPVYIALGQ